MSFLDSAGVCPYCGVPVQVGSTRGAFALDEQGGTNCATRRPGDTRVFLLHGWSPNRVGREEELI